MEDYNNIINNKQESKRYAHAVSLRNTGSSINIPALIKRYQSQYLTIFDNLNKQQIFTKVLKFLQNIIENQAELENLNSKLEFDKEDIQFSQLDSHEDNTNSNKEKKKVEKDKTILSNFGNESYLNSQVQKKHNNSKKVSIMVFEGTNIKQQDFSPLVSEESFKNLSSLNIPIIPLNLKIIKQIYDQPQPFLINLSVCLMLKFIYFSHLKLDEHNASWILAIGTIVAYKIYYDQPIDGIMDCFKQILGIRRQDLIDIQIYFLNQLDHRVIISSYQYHLVLSKIILID